jgi:GntR family transcriptional regulator
MVVERANGMFQEARTKIYPNIGKPLYRQLRDALVGQIESGELAEGDAIPGERTLAELYDISRVTVRKCIGEMVEEGYFIRSHGKETVVAQRKLNHHLGRLVGSIEEILSAEGVVATVRVVGKGFAEGSASVRKRLKIAETDRTPIYEFSRVIIKNDEPLAVNYSFVPYEIGRLVDSLDLTVAKVFPYLENCGYSLSYGEQEISAALCSPEESGFLDYASGQPVMVIRRTTFLENGYPILYEKTVYRGDSYQYSIRLQRKL